MNNLRYLKDVATLMLDTARCIGCGLCEIVCPQRVFSISNKKAHIEDRDHCMECGACATNCPAEAISVKAGVGCASAIINGWITGTEPSCDCGNTKDCC